MAATASRVYTFGLRFGHVSHLGQKLSAYQTSTSYLSPGLIYYYFRFLGKTAVMAHHTRVQVVVPASSSDLHLIRFMISEMVRFLIFWRFGLKLPVQCSRPVLGGFLGHTYPNDVIHHCNPEKA